jgi:hypothetical protein
MMDELGEAAVMSMATGAGTALVTVDGTGTVIAASPSFRGLVGAAAGATLEGRSLGDFVAPQDRAALQDLLVATTDEERMGNGVRLMVTGRRDDGLPLVLDLEVPAAAALTTNVPLEARIALVIERGGGPVTWADDLQPPTPERSGPDHVLSHDARAQVRNARNFLGLFSRKLAESGADPEALPAGFLETGLRALATGDEILDRIVWYLRLEQDPVAMRVLRLDELVEGARRQSQADIDELAALEGQADLAEPASLDVTVMDDVAAGASIDVVGNHDLLLWLLAELLTNARKFAKQPTTIGVTARRRGAWVQIVVRNTGHIIDESLAPDAFRLGRMLQGRGERPGVGLGLSLCRRIALRHGGRMVIEPDPNGTAVTFNLLASEREPVG